MTIAQSVDGRIGREPVLFGTRQFGTRTNVAVNRGYGWRGSCSAGTVTDAGVGCVWFGSFFIGCKNGLKGKLHERP